MSTDFVLDLSCGKMIVDRSRSGLVRDIVSVREFSLEPMNGKYRFRLLLDRYSIEAFFNDGERVASLMVDTPPEADGIVFGADREAQIDLSMAELIF